MSVEKFKIDWSEAPDWANYVAMDHDGDWYWYENSPVVKNFAWYCGEGGGKCERAGKTTEWEHSLQERELCPISE